MLAESIDLTFLHPKVVTLTPNRRLAAFLLDQYQQQQINLGCVVWEQPAIYPLTLWIDKLWQDFFSLTVDPPQKLLTPIEQQLIWEQIIVNSKEGAVLFEVTSTAIQAIDAWNTLLQWDLLSDFLANSLEQQADSAVFKTWAVEYANLCAREGWIDFNSMINWIIKNITVLTPILPEACYLVEHQELSPQYNRFFAALENIGVNIVHKKLNTKPCQNISVVAFLSNDEEYRAAALWAKQSWQQEPMMRVGVVVPDLEISRENIVSIFSEVFVDPIYNIAAPRAISQYALVDIALLLLQFSNNESMAMHDLTKLLRTAFIKDAEIEMLSRAMLVISLQNLQEMELTYTYIEEYCTALPEKHLSKSNVFTAVFSEWIKFLPTLQGQHDSEYWLGKFRTILSIWGWPGGRSIDETEKELLICWELLLQTYLQLGGVLKEHSFIHACKVLNKLAFITPFLPETGKVSIHVLGILEAAGTLFDKLWIMGMHSNAWPMAPAPNPFIPISMQRQYNLPRSSPARELAIAKDLTATFCRCGRQQVVYSFTKVVDDVPTTASRLISQFTSVTVSELLAQIPILPVYLTEIQRVTMEEFIDNQGPIFSSSSGIAPGGSKTLKLQANCPFWAFAELRLQAIPMTKASIGLTSAERGELLHAVLAKFWQQAKEYAYLIQTPNVVIEELITTYINQHLQELRKKRPLTLTANYLELESERMNSLINKWLLYEKQRTPFVVYKIEQQQLIRLGALEFKIRIDRIDQLISGEVVILDYKTGRVQMHEWFGKRMQNPQLPMYCLATEVKPSGIAFAIIRPDSMVFKGVAAVEGLLPMVSAIQSDATDAITVSWQQQSKQWQEQLTDLAHEFHQGVAMVQPLMGTATCRFCHLHSFCRIHEKLTIEV